MIEVNGTSRSHLQDGSWQKNLLYIPQHPYIFDDTLGNNIRFYHPSASAEDTARAAAAAGLPELVDSLPEGLEGRIGEGGRSAQRWPGTACRAGPRLFGKPPDSAAG